MHAGSRQKTCSKQRVRGRAYELKCVVKAEDVGV